MGLRHFHLFFIACSLSLMAVVFRFAGLQQDMALKAVAAGGAVLGLAYLGWFVKRYKTLS